MNVGNKELLAKLDKLYQIMEKAGLNALDCVENFTYLLFLKLLDDYEIQQEQINPAYSTRLGDDQWRFSNWIKLCPEQSEQLRDFIRFKLFPYLANIPANEQSENNDIRTIFERTSFLLLKPDVLIKVLDSIRTIEASFYEEPINTRNTTIPTIAEIYETILAQWLGTHEKLSCFFTPRYLIDFIIRIIDPQKQEHIYDPASGTGGFIIQFYRYTKKASNVSGIEIDPRIHKIGVINAIFHGYQNTNQYNQNALEETTNKELYDVIITNLLFESESVPYWNVDHFPIPSKNKVVLFLQHVMQKLAPKGRAAVIVPDGLLFRSTEEQKVREWLLSKFTVDAVFSLGRGTFMPYTIGKPSILLFSNPGCTENTGCTENVKMYDVPYDTSLDEVYKKWKTNQSDNAVSIEDIAKTGFQLTVSRYMTTEKMYGNIALDRLLAYVENRENAGTADSHIIALDMLLEYAENGEQAENTYMRFTLPPVQGIFQFTSQDITPEFLAHCWRSPQIKKEIQTLKRKRRGKGITFADIAQIKIPFPSFEFQKMYVERLNRQKKIVDHTENLHGFLQEVDVDKALLIEFLKKPLGKIIIKNTPKTGLNKRQVNKPLETRIIRTSNIQKNLLDLTSMKYVSLQEQEIERYALHRKDIVMVRVNANKEYVGKCAVFDEPGTYVFASSVLRIRIDEQQADPFFVALYLNSLVGRQEIDARSKATVQYSISVDDICSIPIPLPPLGVQEQFVDEMKRQRWLVEELHQKREEALKTEQRIFDELFMEG